MRKRRFLSCGLRRCRAFICKQDLAGLAPKGCFIPAEAIECVIGQIGETQKAMRELSGQINGRSDRFRHRAGHDFRSICYSVQFRIAVETDRVSPPEQRIDNLSRGRVNGLLEPTQMLSLNFEEAGFHRRGAAQPPQQTR